jgi:hypothetical protein
MDENRMALSSAQKGLVEKCKKLSQLTSNPEWLKTPEPVFLEETEYDFLLLTKGVPSAA